MRLSSNLAEMALHQSGDTNQEYLYRLLTSEIEYRQEVRISKMLNTAGFPQRYDFSQFHAGEVQFPSSTTLENLKEMAFYEEGKNIVMYGSTGTGKTMLSICIGIEACNRGIPVKFFRTASLVNQLSENKAAGRLSTFIKSSIKPPLSYWMSLVTFQNIFRR